MIGTCTFTGEYEAAIALLQLAGLPRPQVANPNQKRQIQNRPNAPRPPKRGKREGGRRFRCRHGCGKTFRQCSTRQVHHRVHTGEKPYTCRECAKRFADHSSLAKHTRVHTGEKPYGCAVCGVRFSQSSNMKRHFHSKHP